MQKYFHDIATALDAIIANRLRSLLTALGIIFGVAAVISMLAIGKGAQQEILEQIKLVGVNNIIITPILESDDQKESEETEESVDEDKNNNKQFSKGLNLDDVEAIKAIIPTAHKVCPEISIETQIIKKGKLKSASLYGVTPEYFDLFNLKLLEGKIFGSYQNI